MPPLPTVLHFSLLINLCTPLNLLIRAHVGCALGQQRFFYFLDPVAFGPNKHRDFEFVCIPFANLKQVIKSSIIWLQVPI